MRNYTCQGYVLFTLYSKLTPILSCQHVQRTGSHCSSCSYINTLMPSGHLCIVDLCNWFRQWLVVCMAPSNYLNQWWLVSTNLILFRANLGSSSELARDTLRSPRSSELAQEPPRSPRTYFRARIGPSEVSQDALLSSARTLKFNWRYTPSRQYILYKHCSISVHHAMPSEIVNLDPLQEVLLESVGGIKR